MSSSFNTSEFRLRSLLVIPQIFLSTDISKTRNFFLCSSLSVQVLAYIPCNAKTKFTNVVDVMQELD